MIDVFLRGLFSNYIAIKTVVEKLRRWTGALTFIAITDLRKTNKS